MKTGELVALKIIKIEPGESLFGMNLVSPYVVEPGESLYGMNLVSPYMVWV